MIHLNNHYFIIAPINALVKNEVNVYRRSIFIQLTGHIMEGWKMARFVDDLVGAIYDFFKFIFSSICYITAGMLIVGVPLYLITSVFIMLH